MPRPQRPCPPRTSTQRGSRARIGTRAGGCTRRHSPAGHPVRRAAGPHQERAPRKPVGAALSSDFRCPSYSDHVLSTRAISKLHRWLPPVDRRQNAVRPQSVRQMQLEAVGDAELSRAPGRAGRAPRIPAAAFTDPHHPTVQRRVTACTHRSLVAPHLEAMRYLAADSPRMPTVILPRCRAWPRSQPVEACRQPYACMRRGLSDPCAARAAAAACRRHCERRRARHCRRGAAAAAAAAARG